MVGVARRVSKATKTSNPRGIYGTPLLCSATVRWGVRLLPARSPPPTPLVHSVHVLNAASLASSTLAAYDNLPDPVDLDAVLPSNLGKWPVSRPMARALSRLVVGLKRTSVLEFGAGWSSAVLARALRASGGGRLTSVEHQPAFMQAAWAVVQAEPSVDAALVVAGLHRAFTRHGPLWSYRDVRRLVAPRGPFDLVLIDAPPGSYGRSSPLHDAFPLLAPGAVLVVDDAGRASEQRIIQRWLATYPGLHLARLDLSVERGIAVLVYDGNPARRFAPHAVAGTWRDELRRWRARRAPASGA